MRISGRSLSTEKGIELKIKGGRIDAVEAIELPSEAPYLSPGFIDLQVNGYRGVDYSREGLDKEDVPRMTTMLAAAGTTMHLPTLVTGPQDRLLKNLAVINAALTFGGGLEQAIPGIHMEGPYLSGEDGPRGVHDFEEVRDPKVSEYEAWQEASGGRIVMVTLAPERPGALDFIERLADDGVVPAIGHTAAEPDRIREAVAAGARFSTHLGNGCHALLPRHRNYIWEQLAEDQLTAGLIVDGFHLPRSLVKVMASAKGIDNIAIVSDVAPLGGSSPGVDTWGKVSVQIHEDGHLGVQGTEFLAGAGHLLDRGVAMLVRFTGATLEQAVQTCSRNPAAVLGLEKLSKGLVPGAPANLVLFDYKSDWEALRILETWREGELIWNSAR
ncbi:MAG: amidohydrolase family protein [Alkalispirochaeta sp.]